MNDFDNIIRYINKIEHKIGYTFVNKEVLALAFVHRSFLNENRSLVKEHNERLEFLGDSILGFLIAEYLYKKFPEKPEGELSALRSRLVEAKSCVYYVNKLELEEHLVLGKGEKMNCHGRGRDSILADLFEAIIAAIYLDGGMEKVRLFLFSKLQNFLDDILDNPIKNWKAELQDFTQKNYQDIPSYIVIDSQGPDHCRIFHIAVNIAGKETGRGVGASKKEAEQNAAKAALQELLTT